MIIAIIPARGGSKRIPRKNIKPFLGEPIISYSIKAAINSGIFDKIIVSTDDLEIAEVAKKYGAEIPFLRTAKTADDFATTADVISEVLAGLAAQGENIEIFCCLYPTAPFVTAARLSSAFSAFQASGSDSLMPVVPFSYPPLRGLVVEASRLKMKWPENIDTRSQDLPVLYHDAGQFYFARVNAFLDERTLFCKNTIPLFLSELDVQDIDNETDWSLAELKYKLLLDRECML